MNKIIFWILIVWLSIKWMFRITLGDKVLCKGLTYIVANGPAAPYWDLQIENGMGRIHIHESEFKKLWSFAGMVRSFKSGYSFYMGYWYSIWVREGIKPWMKACKIW